MLQIQQYLIRHFCIYLSILTIFFTMSSRISAATHRWGNYRNPFEQSINIPLFGGSKTTVTLPAGFLADRDEITLNVDIESNFSFRIDGLLQKGFEGFTPKISVNGGKIFGNYSIFVKELPVRQITKVIIKTKYLKVGKNEFEFTFGKKSGLNYKCKHGSECIGYFVRKLWFEDLGMPTTATADVEGLAPSRIPILRLETGLHSAAQWAIGTDAESRYLVTGSNDKTIRIWDLSSYKLVRVLRPPIDRGQEGEIRAVAISPGGETIACGGITGRNWDKSYCVYLFNRRSGELVRRLEGFPGSIHHLAYSKTGRFLAVGFNSGVRVYRIPDYTFVGDDLNYGSRCSSTDFSKKEILATSSHDGYIRLYKISGNDLHNIAKQKAPSGPHLFYLKFSADGSKIAVSYLKDKNSPPTIDVLSSHKLKYLYSPDTSGLPRNLEAIAWSSDGQSLYAGGYPFKVKRKHVSPIFRWDDEGRGDRTRLRGGRFPIQDICPLKNGGVAFISYNTAWGIIDWNDKRVFIQRPAIAVFAGHPRGFPISPDASKVFFSYKPRFKIPAIFDVKKRTLEVYPDTADNLIWPRVNMPGLDITDWRGSKHPKLNGVELKLQKNETSMCLALAPDGNSFVLGSEWELYRFDRKGKQIWKVAVPAVTHSVNISQNSDIAVAAIADGTIRWYRMKDGKEILALFPHNDRERWIAWTPEGYYMSSPYGDDLIGWQINNGKSHAAEFYTAMQFERILYRPDKVLAYFHHHGDPPESLKELDHNVFDIKNLAAIAPPKISIIFDPIEKTSISTKTQLKITAEKTSLPMQYYSVFVNNIPITAAADRILSGSDRDSFIRNVEIPLFHSENRIRVEVFNGTSLGIAKTAIYLADTPEKSSKGNICLVAVGVNHFNHIPDLDYAAFDAENFAKFFIKRQGEFFNKVYTKVISDYSESKPSRKNIIESLEFLKQAEAQDTVIVFLASHGLSDSAGNYYFLPKDVEPNDLKKLQEIGERGAFVVPKNLDSLISWELFFEILRSVPGKRLLVVDTCYAKKISGTLDIHSLAKRSATSSFALLAASQANEQSQEYPKGKQGLFTYGLLKGLSGDGDLDRDGQVTLSEIYNFVSNFVENNRDKRLGKQTPQLAAPIELKDMVLGN